MGDPAFDELHEKHVFAAVKRGVFSYHGRLGHSLLHSGALLLGNQGCCYSCRHSHSDGDQCFALQLDDLLYSEIAATQTGDMNYRFLTAALPLSRDVYKATVELELALKASDKLQQDEAVLAFVEIALRRMSQADSNAIISSKDAQRITNVIGFVEEHICDVLTLDKLANRVGLSPYHFLRVFKHHVGMTPHQFILQKRLKLAVDFLLTTKLPIIEVAMSSGFGDLSTFNKTFKAQIGKTPRMLRQ